MALEKNSENKWIIKSENKILGPYNFDQIEELIQKKQISLIDEVRDTETRWLYVRENPAFKSIVESIRKEFDSKLESTKTLQTATIQTGSKTIDESLKTKTEGPTYTQVESEIKDISFIKEIIENNSAAEKADGAYKKEKVKLYGLQSDRAIGREIENTKQNTIVYVVVAFVLIVSSIGGYFYYQKYSQQKQEEQWTIQIKKYKFLGLEKKAVEIYSRLPVENQKKLLPEVVELFPILEANGLMQINDISHIKNNPELTIEQKTNIELVQFWEAMLSQNFGSAQDFIVKASSLQPSSTLIKENEAIIYLKKGQFQKSLDLYLNLYKKDSSGRYLFGMVQAILGLPEVERLKQVGEVSHLILNYTTTYYDYRKELLLAQLVFSKWLKQDDLFLATWKQFENMPCLFSNYFKKPTLLAPNTYQWKDLSEYSNILRTYLTTEEVIFFEINSQIELGQVSSAVEYAKVNLSKIKDVQQRQQLNLIIDHALSKMNDIISLEKTNQLDLKSELNNIILALNKLDAGLDIDKHIQFFKDNKLSFYSDWFQLMVLSKQKNYDQIKFFLREHFVTVTNFIPALEAKSLIE